MAKKAKQMQWERKIQEETTWGRKGEQFLVLSESRFGWKKISSLHTRLHTNKA